MLDAKLIWFLIGMVLILLEFAVPAVVIVFFGLGAWVTALTAGLGLADSPTTQLLIFSISSILLLFGLRHWVKKWFVGTQQVGGNKDIEEEFVGKQVTVLEAISGTEQFGKIELKGATWQAHSMTPLAKGSQAIIVSRDGLTLEVKPLSE